MCSDGDRAIESILRPHYDEVYRLFLDPRDAARKLYADGVFAESADPSQVKRTVFSST